MSLFMQEFKNPTEEIFFKLSAGVLRFEYWILILVGLVAVTVLINYFLHRKKSVKPEKFAVKPIDNKTPSGLQVFLQRIFIPALGFLGRGVLYFWNVLLIVRSLGRFIISFGFHLGLFAVRRA